MSVNGIHRQLSASQKFGIQIENWVVSHLEGCGHNMLRHESFFDGYDFSLAPSGLVIEVKASAPTFHDAGGRGLRKRWAFNLERGSLLPDFYILVVVSGGEKYPYIVPGGVLKGKKVVTITSHPNRYFGKLAPYLRAWGLLGQPEPVE